MLTLQQQTVNFNKNLVFSNNGGNLSNDVTLILVAKFMHQIRFKESRKFYKYRKNHLFNQPLTQLIVAYFNDTAANKLTKDLSFKLVLGNLVASQQLFPAFLTKFPPRIVREYKTNRKVNSVSGHTKDTTPDNH